MDWSLTLPGKSLISLRVLQSQTKASVTSGTSSLGNIISQAVLWEGNTLRSIIRQSVLVLTSNTSLKSEVISLTIRNSWQLWIITITNRSSLKGISSAVSTIVKIDLTVLVTFVDLRVLLSTLSCDKESIRALVTVVILIVTETVLNWSCDWVTSKSISSNTIVLNTLRTEDLLKTSSNVGNRMLIQKTFLNDWKTYLSALNVAIPIAVNTVGTIIRSWVQGLAVQNDP